MITKPGQVIIRSDETTDSPVIEVNYFHFDGANMSEAFLEAMKWAQDTLTKQITKLEAN